MGKGVNKVILVGNVGQDPETKYSANGNAITNISVATSESWKDKQTGQQQERSEWHRVAFFNKLAEIVGQYVKKGSKLYIEGSLRTRKWQDQQGQDRYTTEIVASEMQMLDSRAQENGGYPAPQQQPPAQQYQHPPAQPAPQQPAQQQYGSQPQQMQQPPQDSFDDDIPF